MRDMIALKYYHRSKIPTHSVDEDKELLLQALIKINNLKRKLTFKLEDDVKIPSKTTPSITTATATRPTDTVPLYQVSQQRPTDVVPLYHVPQHGPANVVPMYQMPQQQQQTTDAVPLYQIKVITKLPNSEQSYKRKVKTHNYINRQNQSTTGKL
jgi:hypothetical protein